MLYTVKDGTEVLERIEQTDTWDARAQHAEVCLESLKLSVPTVIDGEDNRVNIAYAGWPDRMYVVGIDGRIAYQGGPGPAGFKPAEVEVWLNSNFQPPWALASAQTWTKAVRCRRLPLPGSRIVRLLRSRQWR